MVRFPPLIVYKMASKRHFARSPKAQNPGLDGVRNRSVALCNNRHTVIFAALCNDILVNHYLNHHLYYYCNHYYCYYDYYYYYYYYY